MKKVFTKIVESVPVHARGTIIKGAIAGLAIAALLPRAKEEVRIEIEDLGDAKRLISSIKTVSEYHTAQYLKGEIDEDVLVERIDESIFRLSEGKLTDKEEFAAYESYYNELMSEL